MASVGKGAKSVHLLAYVSIWFVLNATAIICLNERVDCKDRNQAKLRSLSEFEAISSGQSLGSGLHARLLAPTRSNCLSPLVVFLHGAGQQGHDNTRQLIALPRELLLNDSYTILAPQCPPGAWWNNRMPELEQLIEQTINRYHVDPNRVYLTGISMGGYGCWELAARRPDLFAAVVPVCGGGKTGWAKSLKNVPLWAIHGSEDTVILPERSREMINAIKSFGGTPRYTELPGVGHDSWKYAYDPDSGILAWMFQQRRSSNRK